MKHIYKGMYIWHIIFSFHSILQQNALELGALSILREDLGTEAQHEHKQQTYRKTSSISRAKYQNLNVSCLLL